MANNQEIKDQIMLVQEHMSKAYDHAFNAGRAKTVADNEAHNALLKLEHDKAMHGMIALVKISRDTPGIHADLTGRGDML